MKTALLKFSGTKPSCVKCGGRDCYRFYHSQCAFGCGSGFQHRLPSVDGEHFETGCRTCGYKWQEQVRPPKRRRKSWRKV